MHRYVGGVRLGQSAVASATIDDIDAQNWRGSLRDSAPRDLPAASLTVYLLDGERAGAFALAQLEHRDGYAILVGSAAFEQRS